MAPGTIGSHRRTPSFHLTGTTLSTSPLAAVKKQEAWRLFTRQSKYRPAMPPRINNTASYPDLTEEFLSHAKLYCFADKYGVIPLADLCLENLRISLIDCECQNNQVQGIIELLAFTAGNTPPLSDQNNESLRLVVLDFAIIVFELLLENETFQQLLEEGGNIVKEMLLLLKCRLD